MALLKLVGKLQVVESLQLAARSCLQVRHYRSENIPRNTKKKKNYHWAEPMLKYAAEKRAQEGMPPQEPSMLHVVRRVKPLPGRPWWERQVMERLGLGDTKMYEPVVVKNIPSVNEWLKHVKHLVQIQPLTFPHGLPEDESDFEHCFIKSNGELVVKKKISAYEPADGEDTKPESEMWAMDVDTIVKNTETTMRLKRINMEHFKEYHRYRYNQDGKEYRYTHNKNLKPYTT